MASFFVVAQYVPDVVADERINIGVLVYGDGTVRSRFLSRWDRVQQFAMGKDIEFLRQFELKCQSITEAELLALVCRFANTIQLTEPRGALYSSEELFERAAGWFLKEPVSPAPLPSQGLVHDAPPAKRGTINRQRVRALSR